MKTTILFCLLFVSQLIQASELPRQNIRGKVKDQTTQLPLPGASIVLLNTSPLVGATSDEMGNFNISGIEIGRYSLKFSYIGYKDIVLNNLLLNTGKELILEVELEESVFQQNEVVVTASGEKSDPINSMAVVSARGFTVEETGRYAGSRNDVARMASNYAGVLGANSSWKSLFT